SLRSDPHVKLKLELNEPTDPLGFAPDGRIRLYEVNADFFELIGVDLEGNPNASASQPDLAFSTDFTVRLGATELTYPGIGLQWVDVDNPLSVRITGVGGLTDLITRIKSTMVGGLDAVADFAQ